MNNKETAPLYNETIELKVDMKGQSHFIRYDEVWDSVKVTYPLSLLNNLPFLVFFSKTNLLFLMSLKVLPLTNWDPRYNNI